MIKCINSNIEIYSDGNYNYNNWNLINNNGIFNILNNTSNRIDFCILQSGNIGIGSTSPQSKLDVVGDVSILGRTTLTSNLILINTLSTAPIAQFGTNAITQSNVYIIGGSSGRIGIGSSSPTAPLDVVGSANISGLITANGGLIVPAGQTLNVIGELASASMNATTINTAVINASETINANGGILLPFGSAIIANGGIYTTSISTTDTIYANSGIILSAGSLLSANGGISATTINASGLINANNGLTIPSGKVMTANGGISATTIETSDAIQVKSTSATTPLIQCGTNASATNNLYFIGGGRARIGIGSSAPTVSLDVVGNANISDTISTTTIGASGAISANMIVSTTTIQAGDTIQANGGITVPDGKQIVASGGITATGIQATTINTTGVVNTNGGIISGSTITAYGLITANSGLSASTITSLGIINATAGISATTIDASSAIKGTTVEMSGFIKNTGGIETTTIVASGRITANNGILASSIHSTGVIIADTATSNTPIAQFGTNANASSNLYFIGGGNARIGIGSSSPTVSLDVVGNANITGTLTIPTISASQLITSPAIDVLTTLTVKSATAITPNAQIGTNTDASSNLYFIGGGRSRIGIGSSSPNNALDIQGSMNITGFYKKNERDVILDTSNYILATSNIIANRFADYIPYTWAINSQTFNLNYTLGNVGIGTINPAKKLHIVHPSGELIRIETTVDGANQVSGIEFGTPSYNTATRSKITSTTYANDGGDGSSGSDLQFSTASATNTSSPKLTILPDGKVGIGTQNPLAILQIGNAGRLRIANTISDYTILGTADTDDTTNTKIELSGNTRYGSGGNDERNGRISYVATNTQGSHQFMTNSSNERMRITSSGNVGIGTTTPEQLLTLYGSNAILKIKNSIDAANAASVAINLDNGEQGEWIISNSNNSLAFNYKTAAAATSNRLIIDGVSGNLGIGTNPDLSSNYKLNIVGNIQIGGDIIPSSSNTYNLGSLTNKWKDLYLSGNSIYLDDLILSRDSNINLNVKDLRGNYRDINVSNIQFHNTSNTLTIGIDANGNIVYNNPTSNKTYYPVTTPYINNTTILDNVNDIILSTSNYAIESSNSLTNRITDLDNRQSNYVFSTNDSISTRITNLTTDMINEDLEGAKKFIINHAYNNNLLINGTLTINSNLIVYGESTTLETTVYTTERLEIVNENNASSALMIQQKDTIRDIFIASNLEAAVFTIENNGDVNILGNYKKNNRDVLFDTSNYVLSTSNILVARTNLNDANNSNYISSTSNVLYNNIAFLDCKFKLLTFKVNLNDANTSNYIQATSNILSERLYILDQLTSNAINNSITTLNNNATFNDANMSNYILSTSNNLINYVLSSSNTLIDKANFNDLNVSNYVFTTSNNLINYVLSSSNTLIDKANFNDTNTSNYILSTSNNLINYVLSSSNTLIDKANFNDLNISNYVFATSNNLINYVIDSSNTLINKANFNDANTSNYVLTTSNNLINYVLTSSNTLINKANFNDLNISNYVFATSNNLINYVLSSSNTLIAKANANDLNVSNYVLTTSNNLINYVLVSSNTLINKASANDLNMSNYVFATSNNLINYVRTSSNTLIAKANFNDLNMSNYVLTTSNNLINYVMTSSNTLINKANFNDLNVSNYVFATSNNLINYVLSASNVITKRITDLKTDMITEKLDASNKFIVNNRYNNNLEVNGSLTINSNLIVLGDTTQLETVVYTAERLEVINTNNTSTALMVQQNTADRDIFVASNINTAVFRIANNGDVHINGGGVYKRNNRDVILDTSNYVSSTRDFLLQTTNTIDSNTSQKITVLSNAILAINYVNDANVSNYVLSTSNILSNSISTLNTKVDVNNIDSSNYVSMVNESLIHQITELNNSQLNYVLTTSSNIGDGLTTVIYNMNLNDRNASNYITNTSNIIQRRINEITTDKIVEGAKNRFIIENKYNSNLEIKGSLIVNSNFIVNSLASLRNNVTITGDVNFTGELYKNGMLYPNGKTYTGSSSILSQYSPIQTQFTMYKNVVEKTGSGWQFIDNDTSVIDDKVQGFGVRIKPNHYSSKVLINLNCHIGIDYGTDARWWGLRLYRRIGEAGVWEHLIGADGTDGGGSSNATTCWLSHNLGAESSTSSYFIANVSGAYYDFPETSEDYVYYTVKWCSLLGDDTQNGKLYLNRPAVINALNAPIVSSSWNVSEIWQLETSYFPKGGIVTKYTPTQTQFNIYKNLVEKVSAGWQFIDNDTSVINNTIQGFCVRIMPNHYTSKVLLNLNCHIGIDYGTDARWWGLRLYRRIGEAGAWVHLTDADGTDNNNNDGTPCWLSHNLGAESSTYSYFIANVSGSYYDFPNTMDTYVYYTVKWCSHLGDIAQNGKLYLNRPATYHTYNTGNTGNTGNSAILSSSWNAQEIWQRETTFIPKNAVICQNMSIQTLFNIYRNIVVKSGNGWQFIDNNINIINEKIQGFCVRIKPTHPSSKVLVHLSCHIGIDYGTDARWWGLRLYRRIGEAGTWEHITEADGNNLIDNQGTSCWLSHNLGAESSTSSYFVANISGSFFDLPNTSSDFVYYTAKWCSILGDSSLDGKIYLNRPATYNEMNTANSAVLSSSWNAQEIWQLGTPYEPTEYSIINIFNNNNVGIGTTNPVCKLDVDGTINAINYSTISDRRYKKDIKAVDSSLGIINRLRPVSYLTIAQDEGDRRNYGFIAQDLHEVIPEAVNVPVHDNHNYTIEYMSLIPLLTKSIQELSEKINEQQKTIEDLTRRLMI